MINFSKYQGTGNDFVMIDNRDESFPKTPQFIANLCHRRFGIGADGLILLEKPSQPQDDFKMVYYNADGHESTMCGNGGRCIVKFAFDLGIIENKTNFSAIDGAHEAVVNNETISLKMGNVSDFKKLDNALFIDSGSPHYICFVNDISAINIEQEGRKIRNSKLFKDEGVNVNFVEVGNKIHTIRTYERGVEAETYSCGTGVTAAALALNISEKAPNHKIEFKTLGGKLTVEFQKNNNQFTDIWLSGPAKKSFSGEINNNK